MSAYKIVQLIPSLITSGVGVTTTSAPIALRSGYLRIVPDGNAFIDVSATPGINTSTAVYVAAGQEFIWRENVGSQKVVGVSTGTTTTITLPEGNFTEFSIGDYVQLTGISAGIDTNFATVATINSSLNQSTGGYSRVLTLNWNTTSQQPVVGITTGEIRKVVKVAASSASGNVHITEVQIAGG